MSLQITKGTCDGRSGRYNCCGAPNVWIYCKSRGQCQRCSAAYKSEKKKSGPHRKKNSRQVEKALQELEFKVKCKEYYLDAIRANIKRNEGKCLCDNCGELIPHPMGIHVCHVVGFGALRVMAAYLDPRNNFILGKGFFGECRCGIQFDDKGEKEKMAIYQKYLEMRTLIFSLYR